MKWITNLFDGDISKRDKKHAASRILVIVFSLIISLYLVNLFFGFSNEISIKSAEPALIANNKNLADAVKLPAMKELSALHEQSRNYNFFIQLLQSTITMIVSIVFAMLSGYVYTRYRWSDDKRQDSPELKEYADVKKTKMIVLAVIFSTVLLSMSILMIAFG